MYCFVSVANNRTWPGSDAARLISRVAIATVHIAAASGSESEPGLGAPKSARARLAHAAAGEGSKRLWPGPTREPRSYVREGGWAQWEGRMQGLLTERAL
jgi:hypothetical protein